MQLNPSWNLQKTRTNHNWTIRNPRKFKPGENIYKIRTELERGIEQNPKLDKKNKALEDSKGLRDRIETLTLELGKINGWWYGV